MLRLDTYLREKIQLQFPKLARAENIYNYSVLMESFVPPDISPQSYGHVLIPNVTSIRTEFLVNLIVSVGRNCLLVVSKALPRPCCPTASCRGTRRRTTW